MPIPSNPPFLSNVLGYAADVSVIPGTNAYAATSGNITSTQSTGGSQPHSHDLTGASEEASSLPPYYALSFIMRCA